jgi:hypothetical protein
MFLIFVLFFLLLFLVGNGKFWGFLFEFWIVGLYGEMDLEQGMFFRVDQGYSLKIEGHFYVAYVNPRCNKFDETEDKKVRKFETLNEGKHLQNTGKTEFGATGSFARRAHYE